MKTNVKCLFVAFKTLSLMAVMMFFSFQVLAQKNENDTTKIQIGKKKILIVDNNSISELRTGILEFKQQITELQDSINKIKAINQEVKSGDPIKNEKLIAENERKIAELEKQVASISKGIAETEQQITEMRENKKSNHGNNNWNGNFNMHKKHSKFNGHWAGFEMGLDNFLNSNNKMEMPAGAELMELKSSKSWDFAINFLEYNIPLAKSYVGLTTGMGIEWNGYTFDKRIKLTEDAQGMIISELHPENDYTKNKLVTTFINVPLLFEFQIPVNSNDGRVHFAFGVVGGVRTGSYTKQRYEINSKKYDDKVKDDFQLSPYRWGYTARIGYGALNLFANYSVTPLFKNHKGPELYPFTIGISFPVDNY